MKPAPFEYQRPDTIDEALELLTVYGSAAKILAGGQSLVAMMNFRLAQPEMVIDINGIQKLAYHEVRGDTLHIGALTRHNALRESEVVRASVPLALLQRLAAVRGRLSLCADQAAA
ncbi:FAD binding domain-containing protein, partial [Sphingobium indicum]|uniref:FAD binding domain-containing protein n=1 Tax=Sphingobium indicum TaxID=332055 RepID=UPI0035EB992E